MCFPWASVQKSKKTYYAYVDVRVLELYKSAKDLKIKKEPKYLFDLAIVFNVHEYEDPAKEKWICLMMPDETFLMHFEEPSEFSVWIQMLILKVRRARSIRVGTELDDQCIALFDVMIADKLQYAWDMEPVRKPKFRWRPKREDPVADIVDKYADFLLGKKRYTHRCFRSFSKVLEFCRLSPQSIPLFSFHPSCLA
ncbi:unnamed protein product [Gongylonema pulchrum]|uniref:PH domain-containing protein n=1 Tax=Gongylonema pulchrum TaxID=637853 RepID=A0A183EUT6_9BILA|nr:unnamed protein product [Gongylonema pulchrum]